MIKAVYCVKSGILTDATLKFFSFFKAILSTGTVAGRVFVLCFRLGLMTQLSVTML